MRIGIALMPSHRTCDPLLTHVARLSGIPCRFVAKAGVHKMRIQNIAQLDKVIAKTRAVGTILGLEVEIGDTTALRALLEAAPNSINAEVAQERVILSGECFFVKVFLKQIGFKWDIEAKEWYIMLADATPTVATDLNEICSEWGLTVTGVTEF
tara:strand:- start:115 stop:576 length:462 start_codon:yes stop_codon:yes gene_type:complete